MILLRQKIYSDKSSRFWAGTKGALKGAGKGALIGTGIMAYPAGKSFFKEKKTLGIGLAAAGATLGAGIGGHSGWKRGIAEWESDKTKNDPGTKSKIEGMLPRDYRKFIKLEEEIEKLNKSYRKSCTAEEWAILEFNSFGFDEENNIIYEWMNINKEYRDSLVPVCHFVGYYYDDINHTTMYYNPKNNKYYIAFFGPFATMKPRQEDPKKSVLKLLETIKEGVQEGWNQKDEEDDNILNPAEWEKEYYTPCKRLINSIL